MTWISFRREYRKEQPTPAQDRAGPTHQLATIWGGARGSATSGSLEEGEKTGTVSRENSHIKISLHFSFVGSASIGLGLPVSTTEATARDCRRPELAAGGSVPRRRATFVESLVGLVSALASDPEGPCSASRHTGEA